MSDAAFIYPITPSSNMGELVDQWSSQGRKNVFGQELIVRVMESEAGAAGAVHGSLAVGALTTTFTASQGLLLMIPNMYKIAGELMPTVFHVAARAVAGQALSIFGDHSDVMAVRQTGFALLSSHSVQEVMDLALVAHLATLESSVPFVHFFDGFRLSHEVSKIDVISYETMAKLINIDCIQHHRDRALNPLHPHLRGTSQAPDVFFQQVEASNKYYLNVPDIVENVMRRVEAVTGRSYHLFDYVGASDADRVIVVMGAGSPVVEEAVNYMNQHGEKVGVVKVRLYRPWSRKHFLDIMPKTVKRICVLDRTKESGSMGEPLYLDVAASLQSIGDMRLVVGGRFGLGSKDFTPGMAKAVFDNLKLESPKRGFTVGIEDDVTMTSLAVTTEIDSVPEGTKQCMFYGMGSDGTVGANKNAIKIIGDNTDLFVQGYFAYDAHKSGGVTVSHLRFGPKPITAQYLIQRADYIACHNPGYVNKYQMLTRIKDGGTFVLNSTMTPAEMEAGLPGSLKRMIAQRHVKFYNVNAVKVAEETGMGKRINNIMQAAFFKLSGVIPFEQAMILFKTAIKKTYGEKGDEVVKMNWLSVDKAIENLQEIHYPASWAEAPLESVKVIPNATEFVKKILGPVTSLEGDSLPVSIFEPGGCLPLGTTKFEKRGIAIKIPIWNKDNCTQCNYCSIVCPHAAIRPFVLSEAEAEKAPFATVKSKSGAEAAGMRFRIQVSPWDCTGCEICAITCPDDALHMEAISDHSNEEEKNWDYAIIVPNRGQLFDRTTLKGSQYQPPLMEFSGACEGCGETPYVKLLTQLFGERMIIANATGCSSIWGGSYPYVPYTTNAKGHGPAWGNSLFEDNAEYGFGMTMGVIQRRKRLATLIEQALKDTKVPLSAELKESFEKWLAGKQDPVVAGTLAASIPKLLEGEKKKSETLTEIARLQDLLPKFSHWIIGGDGWAYDIGFGGLDHVLAQGEDVKVVVLDTEMYSNTGGQTSKSTPLGSIAKFSSSGKRRAKKDLGMMAMAYGDVYVASCSMGANFTQTIRAMVEAEGYSGSALILCYSPCIEHGLRSGMAYASQEEKLAVDSGYWPLYRFNPMLEKSGANPFQLDSKKLKIELKEFLERENRFATLARTHPHIAEELHPKLDQWVHHRFEALQKRAMDEKDLLESFQKMKKGLTVGGADTKSMLIIYGSETGNTEELAKRMAGLSKAREYSVRCITMDECNVEELPTESLVIAMTSTQGQGELPTNAREFYKALNDPKLPKDYLKNVKYGVFGLGDRGYAFFCRAGELVNERLAQLGATRVIAMGYGDDRDDEKHETGWEKWLPELWTELKAPSPPEETGLPEAVVEISKGEASKTVSQICPPGCTLLPVVVNRRITPEDHDRDIRHIEFDLNSTGIRYGLGDALAIYPENAPEDVESFLKFYGLNGNDVLKVKAVKPTLDGRKKAAFEHDITVRQIFTELLDVFGRPSRRFYETLLRFATDIKEKEALKHLLSAEGKEEMKKLAAETVTYSDILQKYPSAHPSLEHIIDLIGIIKPRLYTIASAQKMYATMLHLMIVVVDWKTPSGKLRFGTSTGYVRRMIPAADKVVRFACAVKAGTFVLPESDQTPMVMAGLGTGLAPFRAFVQHRAMLKRQGKPAGPLVMYYGCRYRKKDYIYADEWEAYEKEGVLTALRLAFSRDQARKVYIQHKISEDPKLIWEHLFVKSGYFYLCGQAGQMPIDIKNAILGAMKSEGHMSAEEAEKAFQALQIAGRYNLEVY